MHQTDLVYCDRFKRLLNGKIWISFMLREDLMLFISNMHKKAQQTLDKIMHVQENS